jgi:UDP-sugar transporter A1/2/3
LVLLTSGVTIITVSEGRNDSGTDAGKHSDTAFGASLVLLSSMCSSLAGIYFEALIKKITIACSCTFCCCCCYSDNDWEYQRVETNLTAASVWVRNIQLSTITLLISIARELFSHVLSMKEVARNPYRGFFAGFTPWVYLQILLLGGGGLTVAAVIKYTDNVRKGIATGISVVVSSLLSTVVFRSALPAFFVVGVSLVLLGLILFNDDLSNVFLKKRNVARILMAIILIKSFLIMQSQWTILLPSMNEIFVSSSSLESSRNNYSPWSHSVDQHLLWNHSGIPPPP